MMDSPKELIISTQHILLLLAAGVLFAAVGLPTPGWRSARWLSLLGGLGLLLRLGLGALVPPAGLSASYWAAASPNGRPERSTEFAWLDGATRLDARLDLHDSTFPVHF